MDTEEVSMAYPQGAVERAMKVQEVIVRALAGKLTWLQAADILGRSPRSVRRLRWRLQHFGYDGLFDRRRQTPSPKRAPVAEVQRVLTLYRERYQGFNVRHFHQLARRQHGVRFCYAFVKKALQAAGLVAKHHPAAAIGAAANPGRASVSWCISMGVAITGSRWCPSSGSH
jgi:Homeodomain-like domain